MLEHKKDGWKAAIALLPTFLLMGVFTFYPIINTFIMAFKQDYNFLSGRFNGIGIKNFVTILTDPTFYRIALPNTIYMVLISVPISILISLLVAVGLNSIKKLQGFFQTVFFLPYVTNTIALGLVFAVVFHKDYGLINNLFNIHRDWLGSGTTYWSAMLVLMIYTVWNGLAFKIIVFLSGLQSIDKQYYQAAQIDGASKGRIFRKITIPLLSPMILYISITSLIGAFKAYTSVIALFGKGAGATGAYGPDNMLITVVGYIYEKLWGSGTPFGVASAGSLVLFAIILVITIFQLWVSKKRVHY